MYKAVFTYSNELMHFNKNHDNLGRFTFGDGDGDGIIDESKYNEKERAALKKERRTLGSKETQNAFDRISTSKTNREAIKNLSAYEKSSRKDVKEAMQLGDEKAANLINSGRMYYKAMLDSRYERAIFYKAINELKLTPNDVGMKFTYEMLRDPEIGGLKVSFNGGKYVTTIKD